MPTPPAPPATADAATVATPVGPFTVVAVDGVVLAAGWAPADELLADVHPALRPGAVRERRHLGPVTAAVRAYLAGDLAAVEAVPVRQQGGPFLEAVWAALRTIPPGRTLTYTELAAVAGRPRAVRAAAQGCARNAAALFVPCHRVVAAGGHLGGYGFGLAVKRWLLAHEGAGAA